MFGNIGLRLWICEHIRHLAHTYTQADFRKQVHWQYQGPRQAHQAKILVRPSGFELGSCFCCEFFIVEGKEYGMVT